MKKNKPAAHEAVLLKDGSGKLTEKQIQQSMHSLTKYFQAIGLPEDLKEKTLAGVDRHAGDKFSLAFTIEVGKVQAKGEIWLEIVPPQDFYTPSFYTLTLEKVSDVGARTNEFLCDPWSMVTVREAVNLMQGRCVYRRPEADPVGEGYWIKLDLTWTRRLLCVRPNFQVSKFLAETDLGGWMGLEEWCRLVSGLERGDRCDLSVGTGKGMRMIKVEADPMRCQLKVMDRNGNEKPAGVTAG